MLNLSSVKQQRPSVARRAGKLVELVELLAPQVLWDNTRRRFATATDQPGSAASSFLVHVSTASHRIALHRIASHRTASHRTASHYIASHRQATQHNRASTVACVRLVDERQKKRGRRLRVRRQCSQRVLCLGLDRDQDRLPIF
jgi:hypothetical protein